MEEPHSDSSILYALSNQAYSSDNLSTRQNCPVRSIIVTVRRDFPIREGEKFGDWKWSDEAGRIQSPLVWSLNTTNQASHSDTDLTPSRDQSIIGWSLGSPTLDVPGRNGGQRTTDRWHTISAEIRLKHGNETLQLEQSQGRNGEVTLTTTGLSGAFIVEILPRNFDNESIVGPSYIGEDTGLELIYKSLNVEIELLNGEIMRVNDPYDPPNGLTHGRVGSRAKHGPSKTELPLSIKPFWWKHPGSVARRNGVDIDMFILHCTSGSRLGNALNQWFSNGSHSGAHYVIDIDGHTIQLADKNKRISSVAGGWDRWERHLHNISNNERSLGVEIINPLGIGEFGNGAAYVETDEPQPYTYEQYNALIRLAKEVLLACPNVRHRIVGHSDVACGPTDRGISRDLYHTRRNWDPGRRFDWKKLEAENLGMCPSSLNESNIYGNIFDDFSGISLRVGDRDPTQNRAAKLGGETRRDYNGTPITLIKQDLRDIGYSLRNINGNFDLWLKGAVDRFRRHFFCDPQREVPEGRFEGYIDKPTAEMIRIIKNSI